MIAKEYVPACELIQRALQNSPSDESLQDLFKQIVQEGGNLNLKPYGNLPELPVNEINVQ